MKDKFTYKQCLYILTVPFLFTALILNTLFHVFRESSQYAYSFEGKLINQTYTQDAKGNYVVYQNFTITPLPLMQCNSHSRIVTLNYVPEVQVSEKLDLTVNCQGIEVYNSNILGIIAFTLIFYSVVAIIYLSNEADNKDRIITYSLIICLIICLINFLEAIRDYLSYKRYITGYLGSSDIISKNVFINTRFEYCHNIVANVTNNLINCYNKSYVGECYRTYDEALLSHSSGDVYLDENCRITYDANIWPEYIFFLSLTSVSFVIAVYIFNKYDN